MRGFGLAAGLRCYAEGLSKGVRSVPLGVELLQAPLESGPHSPQHLSREAPVSRRFLRCSSPAPGVSCPCGPAFEDFVRFPWRLPRIPQGPKPLVVLKDSERPGLPPLSDWAPVDRVLPASWSAPACCLRRGGAGRCFAPRTLQPGFESDRGSQRRPGPTLRSLLGSRRVLRFRPPASLRGRAIVTRNGLWSLLVALPEAPNPDESKFGGAKGLR